MSDTAPRRGGGVKRSSQLTYRRRLFVLRRLMAGSADGRTLIADARASFGFDDIYPDKAEQALRHDIQNLRDEFGCVIDFSPVAGYVLSDIGDLALLELTPSELDAFCFLHESFADSSVPDVDVIVGLLRRMAGMLPPQQQRMFAVARPLPRVEHPGVDPHVPPVLFAKLRRAVRHQRLRFVYRSTYSDELVTHVVDPYDLILRDGVTYLEGYCHAASDPDRALQYNLYRAGRIVPESLEVLPDALPPGERPRHRFRLSYRLDAPVTRRRDIVRWFANTVITYHDDGTATIEAETSDLWQARQVLLRYREHCQVLEPPELIMLMRESIERMAARYQWGATDDAYTTLE